MTQIIRISKQGVDVLGTATIDPNNLIFDSTLNTLKIVLSGTALGTINSGAIGTVTIAHNLGYAPALNAFVKKTTDTVTIPVGSKIMAVASVRDYSFTKAYADGTNNYFVVDNNLSNGTFNFRYFNFELPLT